jgi:MerR family transcriptional regulator, light-induced transcriptional regulator
MSNYSIKDVENLSGIKAHTLRIWEQRYEILQPKRTDSNIRYYDDIDLKLILNISLLNKHGFKISKIAEMSENDLRNSVMQLTEKSNEYADRIQALTICMLDMDEEKFEKIMATCIIQNGFETTIMRLILPFMSKIGILWQTDGVNPGQEHFISHLIRQKVIVAIDGQVSPNNNPVAKKYMLFLPEGEWHELSLLFANYLIRNRSQKTTYLGQTLPLKDVEEVYGIYKPEYLLTIITASPSYEYVQQYLLQLGEKFPNATILVSGAQVIGQGLETPPNVLILNKIEDLTRFVEENIGK